MASQLMLFRETAVYFENERLIWLWCNVILKHN
jgi:hypothetical protein